MAAVLNNTAAAPLQERYRLLYFADCAECEHRSAATFDQAAAQLAVDEHNAALHPGSE